MYTSTSLSNQLEEEQKKVGVIRESPLKISMKIYIESLLKSISSSYSYHMGIISPHKGTILDIVRKHLKVVITK